MKNFSLLRGLQTCAGPGLLMALALAGCGTQTGTGGGGGGKQSTGTAYPPITAWGDSLTSGGEGGTGITYPNRLAALTGQTVTNLGIGGQGSSQIAVRMNAYAGEQEQTFAGAFTLPTSGIAPVYFQPGFEPCYNLTGGSGLYNLGVPIQFTVSGAVYTGRCKANVGGGGYNIRPETYPSAPVTVPAGTAWTAVLPANIDSGCVVIWAGRGNYAYPAQVQADMAAMVAVVEPATSCYLVMSVPNGEYPDEWKGTADYDTILALNNALAATYSPGNHYLDIRAAMVALYNPRSAADVLDHGNDVWPYSLRAQDLSGALMAPLTSLTSCALTTSQALTAGQIITVNAEMIQITGGSNGAYACTRGYAGTTPGTYAGGLAFTGVDALHLGQNAQSAANENYTNGYAAVAAQVYAWLEANAPQ
jgi:hypothetical protein